MRERPTLRDVLRAKKAIAPYLYRTPLYNYPLLSEVVGCELYVKLERNQPIGAFKVRGGINLVSCLSAEERKAGVICATVGNTGQSLAYAAHLFGVACTIVMPHGANPLKEAAIRQWGAEVVFHGSYWNESDRYAAQLAAERGYRYVHGGDEPLLIAGVATETLEILEDQPDVEVILVPAGGGSGASGACIVAKAVDPAIQVYAVQMERAPSLYLSWKAGKLTEVPCGSWAEGINSGMPDALPVSILRELLDDFVLVGDDEAWQAVWLYLEKTRNLVEGGGAATLAAAIKIKDRLKGRKVAIVASGGNPEKILIDRMRQALSPGPALP
jgi:threonine dehydratase